MKLNTKYQNNSIDLGRERQFFEPKGLISAKIVYYVLIGSNVLIRKNEIINKVDNNELLICVPNIIRSCTHYTLYSI